MSHEPWARDGEHVYVFQRDDTHVVAIAKARLYSGTRTSRGSSTIASQAICAMVG